MVKTTRRPYRDWIKVALFLSAVVLSTSDGDWFPLPNLAGVALMGLCGLLCRNARSENAISRTIAKFSISSKREGDGGAFSFKEAAWPMDNGTSRRFHAANAVNQRARRPSVRLTA